MESSLDHKRKADEIGGWYFMEYEDMKEKTEKVLGHIVWLLEEAQKPVERSQGGDQESREIKKQRSSSNLAERNIGLTIE
ncbi:3446_t:CDS:2 [Racocetra persica]|uniref:3446_t:CDS:1 n=1 Tax=Racocetra persica TaxID=160502 RepID=A0ACA9RAD9_9GLOM|nr:3446_t:CDS:2 [Racocetra persica]